MAFTRVAKATVAVPLPGSDKKQYVQIGTILESSTNDPSKGLPYILMLDPWIDLQALHRAAGLDYGASLPVSFYNIQKRDWPPKDQAPAPRRQTGFDDIDDDIPF